MCKNILIVDDDANFIWQMMNTIKNQDCSIATANSIDRAENIMKKNNFDFVVANLTVPGGSSVCLQECSSPKTKFIFMSNLSRLIENYKSKYCSDAYYKQDVTQILDKVLVNA